MKCKGLSITCLVLRFLHRLLLDISINFSLLWPLRLHVFLFQDLLPKKIEVTPALWPINERLSPERKVTSVLWSHHLDDTVSYVTPDLDQFDSSKFSDGENTKMNIKILRMRTSTPSQRCCQLQNNNYPSLLWMVSTSAWEKPSKCSLLRLYFLCDFPYLRPSFWMSFASMALPMNVWIIFDTSE